jgi:hypothetical protein
MEVFSSSPVISLFHFATEHFEAFVVACLLLKRNTINRLEYHQNVLRSRSIKIAVCANCNLQKILLYAPASQHIFERFW